MGINEVRKNWLCNVKDSIGKRKLSFGSLGTSKSDPNNKLGLLSQLEEAIEQDTDYYDLINERGALTSDKIYAFKQILADRYTGVHNLIPTYSDAGLKTTHMRLKTNGIELRIKSAYETGRGMDDLTKSLGFANWLSKRDELGYTPIRDKSAFYIVMIEGVPLDKLLQDKDPKKADEVLEVLIDFIGDYYFREDHVIESPNVKEGQALFSVRLYTEATLQMASKLPGENKKQVIDDIRQISCGIINKISTKEPVTYIAPDSKASNFIFIPHDQKNIRPEYIVMNDRGWKDLIIRSVKSSNHELYLGLPFFDIGMLYQTITRSKDYDGVRGRLDECVRNLILGGEWRTRDRTYKVPQHPNVIKKALTLGRLYPIIREEVRLWETRQERARMLNNIMNEFL